MNYAGINCTVILLDLMSEGMGSNWGRVVLCGLVTGIVWYMLSESILIEFYTHENPRQEARGLPRHRNTRYLPARNRACWPGDAIGPATTT